MSQPPFFPPPPANPSSPLPPAGEPPPERRQFFNHSAKGIAEGALNVAGFVPPVARVLRLLGVDPAELQRGAQGAGQPTGYGAVAPRRWPVMTLPPGAVPNFYNVCTRCNDCVKACPHWAIRKAGPELGPALDGVPLIYPGDAPCKLCADLPCVAACEPQALLPLPIAAIRLGAVAVIDYPHCYVPQGRACDECVKSCPVGAQALVTDPAGYPRVLAHGCTGCGLCVQECPASCIKMAAAGKG